MKNERISKEMTIEDIFTSFPEKSQLLAQEITNSGLHCASCSAATWETLEAGMTSHGRSPKEIDALVKRLNEVLEQKSDPSTISLTPKAAKKFRDILDEEDKSDWALRFADRPAGCSGFEYVLDFSEKALPSDQVFRSQDLDIHVPKSSLQRLLGSVIDYVDGLQGAGFKISNPHAKSSCGCGTSHGY
jgi:iron-sulfur cluster assembly protein